MNKEFLSIIYNHLSCLNFSVLPKLVKQKQISITSNSSATDISWNKFLQSFGSLSNCELSYYRFTYLSVKTNNLQDLYLAILNDLKLVCNINKANRDKTITSPNNNTNNASTSSTTTTTATVTPTTPPTTPLKSSSSFTTFSSLLKSSPVSSQTLQQKTIQPLTQQQIDDQNSENSFFLTLAQQTCVILQVRIDMIGVYSALIQQLQYHDIDIENIESSLESIPTIYKDKITHPLLIQIKTNMNYEISILRNLLKVQILVSKHIFKDSILLLFKAKIELDLWRETENGYTHTHKSLTSTSSSSSLSSSASSTSSSNDRWNSNNIHQWLSMFHNSILSKATLYFHFPLLNVEEEIGGTTTSFKEIFSRNTPDYISIIDNFCNKNNVLFFSLIFEAKGTSYNKIGYSFIEQEAVGGIGSYPPLFYYPLDKSPMQHLPNIIGLIMQNYQLLEKPNDILYYLDSRKVKDPQRSNSYDDYITYFISRVETGVFVSITFKDIRKQKDQNINEFLKLLINSLIMNDILSILKQKESK